MWAGSSRVEVINVADGPSTPPGRLVPKEDLCNSEESQSEGEGEDDGEADDEDDEEDDKYFDELLKTIEELHEKVNTLEDQNQGLNDKLFQVRSQAKSEVSNMKQQLEDLKERNKVLEQEKQSLSSQREADLKKYKFEMSRMQEEVKTFQSRNNSMEHKYERSNDRVNELQAKLVEEEELNNQLKEEMRNLQESLTSSSRRAHEAEVKYMCIKKDLIESQLNRVIDRLNEETNRMRQLLPSASDETVPDRHTLSRTIVAWDETMKSLRDRKNAFMSEGLRLLEMVNQGRPLNALPQGDLQIPDIPNISIAPLLCLGQKSSSQLASTFKPKPNIKNNFSPSLTVSPSIPTPAVPQPPGKPSHQPIVLPTQGDFAMQMCSGTQPVVNGGAIPKGAGRGGRSITPDVQGSQWMEGHLPLPSQQAWEYKDGDLKPINVSNHAPNMVSKDLKMTTSPPKVEGEAGASNRSSAYGLNDISQNASVDAAKQSGNTVSASPLHPTPTLTVPKPKFQNLPSSNLGPIGTLPPKLVRPQPRNAPNTNKSGIHGQAGKDDGMPAKYKRLIEVCREKIGKEFSLPDISAALREVRAQNNNSLSGMNMEKIVERVKNQLLRNQRPPQGQATPAPWADLTQGEVSRPGPNWHGPSKEGGAKDSCSICLDPLLARPVMPLQCQHVFHEACIKDWLNRQKTCPNCRKFALTNDEYPSLPHS